MSKSSIPPKTPQFSEGNPLWGFFSCDKITLRVHQDILNLALLFAFNGKGVVTITRAGGLYWDISFHVEGLLPGIALIEQIAFWLAVLSLKGVFRVDLAWSLLQVNQGYWDWSDLGCKVAYIETLRFFECIWAEAEVAIDYPQHNRPIHRIDKTEGHKFKTTLYSDDGVQPKRLRVVEGKTRLISKGRRKDFICEYNRARKISSSSELWRVELRLIRHHLDRFSPYDLLFDFHTWVFLRQDQLVQFLRKAVRPHAWKIDEKDFVNDHWLIKPVLERAGWLNS